MSSCARLNIRALAADEVALMEGQCAYHSLVLQAGDARRPAALRYPSGVLSPRLATVVDANSAC